MAAKSRLRLQNRDIGRIFKMETKSLRLARLQSCVLDERRGREKPNLPNSLLGISRGVSRSRKTSLCSFEDTGRKSMLMYRSAVQKYKQVLDLWLLEAGRMLRRQ